MGDTFGSLDWPTGSSQPSQLAYGLLLAFAHPSCQTEVSEWYRDRTTVEVRQRHVQDVEMLHNVL